MGQRLGVVFVIAVSCGVAAFVVAGLIGGDYPFGPDLRPECSGAGSFGLAATCRFGPLAKDWFEPYLWPAILAFCAVVAIGVLRVRKEAD